MRRIVSVEVVLCLLGGRLGWAGDGLDSVRKCLAFIQVE